MSSRTFALCPDCLSLVLVSVWQCEGVEVVRSGPFLSLSLYLLFRICSCVILSLMSVCRLFIPILSCCSLRLVFGSSNVALVSALLWLCRHLDLGLDLELRLVILSVPCRTLRMIRLWLSSNCSHWMVGKLVLRWIPMLLSGSLCPSSRRLILVSLTRIGLAGS